MLGWRPRAGCKDFTYNGHVRKDEGRTGGQRRLQRGGGRRRQERVRGGRGAAKNLRVCRVWRF